MRLYSASGAFFLKKTIKKNSLFFGYYPKKYYLCSVQIKNQRMKKEMFKMEVTFEEKELIESIRNYCKSYPDGYPHLLEFAQDLFDRMTDMPR